MNLSTHLRLAAGAAALLLMAGCGGPPPPPPQTTTTTTQETTTIPAPQTMPGETIPATTDTQTKTVKTQSY